MLKNIFICPDCSSSKKEWDLKVKNDKEIFCPNCNRKFYMNDSFIDLLPTKPTRLGSKVMSIYKEYYIAQFGVKPHKQFKDPVAWGEQRYIPKGDAIFLDEEGKLVRNNYSRGREVYCDISGSQGNLAFEASNHFRNVYLCDINLEYLQMAMGKAKKLNIKNIIFVRSDYFSVPFRKSSIDTCVSTDSFLYYGVDSDIRVIKSIFERLTDKGILLFDLHNRKFYSPASRIIEYTRREYELLKKIFKNIIFVPLGRVPTIFTKNHFLFKLTSCLSFMPPIRYFCILEKNQKDC